MRVTMADVCERFIADYQRQHRLSADQHRAVHAIRCCRTAALGLQGMDHCHRCGHQAPRYCSCRNRHCPKCQHGATQRWVSRQCVDVLDAPYFHLVFTLPHELNPLARAAPTVLYGLLFESVWSTLSRLGRQRLGGQVGMTAVLHTWGQTLSEHVHLHCLVPAGAFDTKAGRWQRARCRYLFPVRVMQAMYRGAMVTALRRHRHRFDP